MILVIAFFCLALTTSMVELNGSLPPLVMAFPANSVQDLTYQNSNLLPPHNVDQHQHYLTYHIKNNQMWKNVPFQGFQSGQNFNVTGVHGRKGTKLQ